MRGALRSLLQRCHWVLPDLCLDGVKSHLEYLREPHRVTLGSYFSKKRESVQWLIPNELDHSFPSGNHLEMWNIFRITSQRSLPLELFMLEIGTRAVCYLKLFS